MNDQSLPPEPLDATDDEAAKSTGKAKIGRPSKLTRTRQAEIITAIQAGATYEIAATYAGISYSTFNNWMQAGRTEYERLERAYVEYDRLTFGMSAAQKREVERPKPLPEVAAFLEFFNAISEANAIAAVGWLQVIDVSAQQNPVWAAWMLQHRYPRDYGGRHLEASVASGEGSNDLIIRIQYADPTQNAQVIDDAAGESDAHEAPSGPGGHQG